MELCVNWAKAIPRFIADFERFKEPPNYYITFPDLSVGFSMSGGGNLYIGAAIKNWMEGHFIKRCPKCKHKVYVLFAGSVLSGAGCWTAMCPKHGMVTSNQRTKEMILESKIRGEWNKLGYRRV